MSRYLVNFGDSWAWGAGVRELQQSSYAEQLGLATDRQLIDLSELGTSTAHMVLQFRRFIQDHYLPGQDYLAVFFVTAQQRQLAFDSQGAPQEIHPGNPLCHDYYKTVYTEDLGTFNINTVIITLQAMARYWDINDRYLLGWQSLKLWPEIDLTRFYQQAETTAMELLGNTDIIECGQDGNPNFIPGDGHPSLAGHTQIALALARWIQG